MVVFKAEGPSELPSVPFLGLHCEPEKSYLIVGKLDIAYLSIYLTLKDSHAIIGVAFFNCCARGYCVFGVLLK